MFVLASLRDTVVIESKSFAQKFTKNIIDALNKKFANKVVHDVGLCITVWDVTHIGDSILYQGDGAAHVKVEFRMVVFRPFVDEILNGKVRRSSIEGVHVTLDFFEDVFIPADCLPQPCRFIESSQKWVWEYEADGARHNLPIDRGGEIRFKVTEEVFVEKTPTSCDPSPTNQPGVPPVIIKTEPDADDNVPPYTILGSIEEAGLGMLSWWNGS